MRAEDALRRLRAAPVRGFEEIVGGAPFLVLAPHPDDESLGCGGLLAEAAARGHPAHVAVLTDGGMSHPNSPSWPRTRLVAARAREVAAAVSILGIPRSRLTMMGVPDAEAPHAGAEFDAAAAALVALIRAAGIGTVFATWDQDPHGDHGSAAKLAASACGATGKRHVSYPVWAWTLAADAEIPDLSAWAMRLDIGRHVVAKRRAIEAHATQYTGLIDDDPGGFRLPAPFLAQFDGTSEVFIEHPVAR